MIVIIPDRELTRVNMEKFVATTRRHFIDLFQKTTGFGEWELSKSAAYIRSMWELHPHIAKEDLRLAIAQILAKCENYNLTFDWGPA